MFYTAEQKRDYFLLLVCKLSGVLFCTLFGVCSDGIVLAKPALLRQENWSRPEFRFFRTSGMDSVLSPAGPPITQARLVAERCKVVG
jgi:hypothetical protein